jgi:chromosome segregation ATPase
VSALMAEHLPGWQYVRAALAEIHASHEEYGRFFSEVFEQLGAMSAELSQRQDQVEQSAQQRRDHAIAEASAHQQEAQAILDESHRERATLRDTQEAVQNQLDRLVAFAAELSEAHGDLSGVRGELAAVRNELQAERDLRQSMPAPEAPPATEENLQHQIQQMAQQQSLLERDRKELETELELVRGRAAELSESLAEQKRLLAQQQTEWAKEFKRMRCLLEGMSGRFAEGMAPSAAPVQAGQNGPAAATSTSPDPVLNSVLAQFEILQRDVARRRKVAS